PKLEGAYSGAAPGPVDCHGGRGRAQPRRSPLRRSRGPGPQPRRDVDVAGRRADGEADRRRPDPLPGGPLVPEDLADPSSRCSSKGRRAALALNASTRAVAGLTERSEPASSEV